MASLTFLEDPAGGLHWGAVAALVAASARAGCVDAAAARALKERLKTEVLPLILNSLTVRRCDGMLQRGRRLWPARGAGRAPRRLQCSLR